MKSDTRKKDEQRQAWSQQLAQQKYGHHARRCDHAFANVFCQRKPAKRTALSPGRLGDMLNFHEQGK